MRIQPGGRVIDLGCGTGELTQALHRKLQAAQTRGIDNSANMLARARTLADEGLQFDEADIATFDFGEGYDLIFSNAALQWLGNHPALLARLKEGLTPGGQLAIQLPAMEPHPTHTVARKIAQRAPYAELLGGAAHHLECLPPEHYAELLCELGFRQQHVRLQIYGHLLPTTAAVVDWMRGTLLTCYQRRLNEEQFEAFVAEYQRDVLAQLPMKFPFFFAFRRVLLWAKL